MAEKQAMGNDPLDWVGKSHSSDSVPKNGTSAKFPSSSVSSNGKNGVSHLGEGANGSQGMPANGASGAHETSAAFPLVIDSTAELSARPVQSQTANTALEREVLLFGEFQDDHRGHSAQRSSHLLLLLVFVFLFLGMGFFFFHQAQYRWDRHVDTLNNTILSMKTHNSDSSKLVHALMESKDGEIATQDQVIAEKERLIESLMATQRVSFREAIRETKRALEFAKTTKGVLEAGLSQVLPTWIRPGARSESTAAVMEFSEVPGTSSAATPALFIESGRRSDDDLRSRPGARAKTGSPARPSASKDTLPAPLSAPENRQARVGSP